MHRQFWEAGYRIFGIYGKDNNGHCECGNPKCSPKNLLKHPLMSNWQHAPVWSEEQMETMEEMGHFKVAYGVLCYRLLICDVDARNGGVESYARLVEDFPEVAGAGMIVETGSGGGSKHLWFRISTDVPLMVKLDKYPGIDFKSGNHFVIGPGSMHQSGRQYTIVSGSPDEVDEAPAALIEALRRPEHHRADINGRVVDVTVPQVAEVASYIPNNDVDYEKWIRVGMAIHHATGGTAFELWDDWSRKSKKYDQEVMHTKWHSFGKAANPVTLGTLIHYAEEHGYIMPVTFSPEPELDFVEPMGVGRPRIDISGVDIRRPPGAVGKLAEWIESQCRHSRPMLSSAAALFAMGSVIGLHYTDDLDSVTGNFFLFGVAGSGTGKEAVQEAVKNIFITAGIVPAVSDIIKSEQEVLRNLTRHQAAIYVIDEFGIFLSKVKNAQNRGGAPYLEGLIGMLMSAYSKANGVLILSGDSKEETRSNLEKDLRKVQKQLEEAGETPYFKAKEASIIRQLSTLDRGLQKPFLSLAGFTTPNRFVETVDFENATNGFIGRALMAVELDTAPKAKRRFRKPDMPEALGMMLMSLASGGTANKTGYERVEAHRDRHKVPTTAEAAAMLETVVDILEEEAQDHKEHTGLEALLMRGYEMVSRLSFILAAPGGLRTEEHVRWAYAMVKHDIDVKTRMVTANDRVKDNPTLALKSRVAGLIDDDNGETLGVIANRCRGFKREDVEKTLENMVARGEASVVESIHKYTKKIIRRYRLIKEQ